MIVHLTGLSNIISGEKDAERLIQAAGPGLGLPAGLAELAELRKGDPRKALMAAALRQRTTVGFDWIAKRLVMGHAGSVSRQVSLVKRQQKLKKQVDEMEKLFQCGDPRECSQWKSCRKLP